MYERANWQWMVWKYQCIKVSVNERMSHRKINVFIHTKLAPPGSRSGRKNMCSPSVRVVWPVVPSFFLLCSSFLLHLTVAKWCLWWSLGNSVSVLEQLDLGSSLFGCWNKSNNSLISTTSSVGTATLLWPDTSSIFDTLIQVPKTMGNVLAAAPLHQPPSPVRTSSDDGSSSKSGSEESSSSSQEQTQTQFTRNPGTMEDLHKKCKG